MHSHSFAVNEVSYFVPLVPSIVNFKSTFPFHGYRGVAVMLIDSAAIASPPNITAHAIT